MRTWINLLLAAVVVGGREFFRYTGWHVPTVVHFVAIPFGLYMMLEFFGVWEFLAKLPEQELKGEIRKHPSKEKPPTGYIGPFWNKPKPEYLEARARESAATTPSVFAPFLLLVPFAALIILLLRY